jgi:hypothetical protein
MPRCRYFPRSRILPAQSQTPVTDTDARRRLLSAFRTRARCRFERVYPFQPLALEHRAEWDQIPFLVAVRVTVRHRALGAALECGLRTSCSTALVPGAAPDWQARVRAAVVLELLSRRACILVTQRLGRVLLRKLLLPLEKVVNSVLFDCCGQSLAHSAAVVAFGHAFHRSATG